MESHASLELVWFEFVFLNIYNRFRHDFFFDFVIYLGSLFWHLRINLLSLTHSLSECNWCLRLTLLKACILDTLSLWQALLCSLELIALFDLGHNLKVLFLVGVKHFLVTNIIWHTFRPHLLWWLLSTLSLLTDFLADLFLYLLHSFFFSELLF